MGIFKNRIEIENKDFLEEYLRGYDYDTSGISYTSLYMWRNASDITWEMIGDYMCVAAWDIAEDGSPSQMMFPPLTRTGSYDSKALRETIYEARRRFELCGYKFCMRLVPLNLIEVIEAACPGEFRFIADRDNYDYVYDIQELIDLKGREHHAKKNHLNYFKRNYEYQYERLRPEMGDEILRFVEGFNRHKDVGENERELLEMEKDTMGDVFNNMDEIGYFGGVIRINGKIEAFCVGGYLNETTMTEHIEKANRDYRGLYQAINNEFCKDIAARFKYMNREEDMGLPNLRKAKLSLKPIRLMEKYTAFFVN